MMKRHQGMKSRLLHLASLLPLGIPFLHEVVAQEDGDGQKDLLGFEDLFRPKQALPPDSGVPDVPDAFVRFSRCQAVRSPDTGLVQPKVVLSVCGSDCGQQESASCAGGEHVMDLDAYLLNSVVYWHDRWSRYCEGCSMCASDTDDGSQPGVNCAICGNQCDEIEGLELSSNVDASQFSSCQLLHDNPPLLVYAGPVCTQGGDGITVAAFWDEDCQDRVIGLDVDDILTDESGRLVRLSDLVLRGTYDKSSCVGCTPPASDPTNVLSTLDGTEVCQAVRSSDGCASPGSSTDPACRLIDDILEQRFDADGDRISAVSPTSVPVPGPTRPPTQGSTTPPVPSVSPATATPAEQTIPDDGSMSPTVNANFGNELRSDSPSDIPTTSPTGSLTTAPTTAPSANVIAEQEDRAGDTSGSFNDLSQASMLNTALFAILLPLVHWWI